MDSVLVHGGIALQGKVRIQGSKNAALPVLAAGILTGGQVYFRNCPRITDVYGMLQILESLGCRARWEKDALRIDYTDISCGEMPREAVTGMRSSIFLLGALLGRCGYARMEYPGGCVIGRRPVDIHLKALGELGIRFEEEEQLLTAIREENSHGNCVLLDFPSVGATENIIMLGAMLKGVTKIHGAAREPEVQALCDFLIQCGAVISGAGTNVITIEGGRPLHGTDFRIPADRIVAGTWLFAGFAAGGSIFLEEAPAEQMEAVLEVAEEMGAAIAVTRDGIYAQCPERAGELPFLETGVYPEFPTDLQSVLLAVRCTGKERTHIRENLFENRFRIVKPLQEMGADITVAGERDVWITGKERLRGREVTAGELRGGAALVVAALGAEGSTRIAGRRYIDRGYENIARDLRELGARIVSE